MPEYPQLASPPIFEVVCGFVFAPQPLDTMDFGVYWETRRDEFPQRQVQPPILEGNTILHVGTQPQRSWLISEDETHVLQLQYDRFFVNWRRRNGTYPRFSDHDGKEGIRSKAIREFERFAEWVKERTGEPTQLQRLELTKIDVLTKGIQYASIEQLSKLMSVARVFNDIQISAPNLLHLRLVETHNDATTNVQIAITAENVKIETRHVFPSLGNIRVAFDSANDRVNQIFFGLFKEGIGVFGGQ